MWRIHGKSLILINSIDIPSYSCLSIVIEIMALAGLISYVFMSLGIKKTIFIKVFSLFSSFRKHHCLVPLHLTCISVADRSW